MAFTCPRCGRTSHNPNDEREGYCGACHGWTGDQQPGTNRQWRTVVKNMTKAIAHLEQENNALRAENERLRHIAETMTLANGERERRALRAEAEVKRQDEALVKLSDSSSELRAENKRLRWALGKGLTESEAADFLAKEGD